MTNTTDYNSLPTTFATFTHQSTKVLWDYMSTQDDITDLTDAIYEEIEKRELEAAFRRGEMHSF